MICYMHLRKLEDGIPISTPLDKDGFLIENFQASNVHRLSMYSLKLVSRP